MTPALLPGQAQPRLAGAALPFGPGKASPRSGPLEVDDEDITVTSSFFTKLSWQGKRAVSLIHEYPASDKFALS